MLKGLRLGAIGASAGIGAAGGAMFATHSGEDATTGAVIGGAAGTTVGVMGTYGIPAMAIGSAKGIGRAAKNVVSSVSISGAKEGVISLGQNALKTGTTITPRALGSATGMMTGVSSVGTMSTIMSPVRRHAGAVGGFASKMFKYNEAAKGLDKIRLSSLGTSAISIGAAYIGASKAIEAYQEKKMGQISPFVERATPRLPSYELGEKAGATGDLVFALNQNRRG